MGASSNPRLTPGRHSRDGCERAIQLNMSDPVHDTDQSEGRLARVAPTEPGNGWIRPRHGHGMLRPFPKGAPGRIGKPSRYTETLQIAREASPEAMRVLVERLRDSDGRVAVVAAERLLERAWGKVREMKPEEQQKARIDLSRLTNAELGVLLRLVESGRLVAALDAPVTSGGADQVIEGEVSPDR
jgi:hypothetical protein